MGVPLPFAVAAAETKTTRRRLVAIFALALALRLAVVPFAGVYHPDEIFQYLEQAHRLVFGQGLVPWEYRYGMRSWALPLILVPPMALGGAIAPGSLTYLWFPRALAACASLSIVWSAWAFGRRSGREQGLIAAAVAAVWSEFVYFAPHILSESASAALILPAAVMLTDQARLRRLPLAGAMLGFAVILRVQHGPAIASLIILALWNRRAAWPPFLIGIGGALLAGAAIDTAIHQIPFGWVFENVRQNIGHHRSEIFGIEPWWTYAEAIGFAWGVWTAPILALAAIGARRQPLLLSVAIVNLAVHMAIPHKDYRFILLTTTILALLAAIGTGEAVAMAARRWPERKRGAIGIALFAWAIASANLAADSHVSRFAAENHSGLDVFSSLHDDPALCGIATVDLPFSFGGGYTYLHRSVKYYTYKADERVRLESDKGAFNRVITPVAITPLPGFNRIGCTHATDDSPALCILARPGPCRAISSPAEINRALVRGDE